MRDTQSTGKAIIRHRENNPKRQSIRYNDMGKGFERTIELLVNGKEGELRCLCADGTEDRTLCPCCMLPATHSGIAWMISKTDIETLVWPGPYGCGVPERIGILELIEEVKGEGYSGYSRFRIRR